MSSAPRCRKCGKLLAKRTFNNVFRAPQEYRAPGFRDGQMGHRYPIEELKAKPEGHRESDGFGGWVIYTNNRPRTKADCARYTNYPITSVRRHHDGETIGGFTAWDGESYRRCYGYFCTNDCAARFGQIIAAGEL